MKKLFTIVVLLLSAVMYTVAREHTVQRGETLESVARAYNLSVGQLVDANPGADKLFYVGMKLNIPDSPAKPAPAATVNTVERESASEKKSGMLGTLGLATATKPAQEEEIIVEDGPGWNPQVEMHWGFLPKNFAPPKSSFKGLIGFNFSGAYWFMKKESGFFASAGLGFDNASCSAKDYSLSIWTVGVPLKAGYAILLGKSKDFAFTPYVGFDLSVSVSVKQKVKKQNLETESGKFIPGFKAGAMVRLKGWGLGFYYYIPISDDAKYLYTKDGHFAVSLGFGF